MALTPEERQAAIDAGTWTEEMEEAADEIDLVAELVAAGQIQDEERHDEIVERIEQCQSQLSNLQASLSMTSQAENPLLSQLLQQVTEMRVELASLRATVDSMHSTPAPSPSIAPPIPESHDEPRAEPSMEEPSGENEGPKRRSRVYRI